MSANRNASRDHKPFFVRNKEMFINYKRLLASTRRKLIRSKKSREAKREIEVELAWLIKEVEDYGFDFFPDHYVQDKMDRIAALVS